MEPCERFAVLDWRPDENIPKCDVCDHLESSHENPGRRRLSGAQIEAQRRQLIEAMYDKQQAAGRQGGVAGIGPDTASHAPGTNGEPTATDS
ncbi:MAG: hypothetical protein JO036_02400 [Candidatus Eremiobacteraeota bacterium]|nr:hypothetical protein [Candidatus Eremiobacteraeota bacterium]